MSAVKLKWTIGTSPGVEGEQLPLTEQEESYDDPVQALKAAKQRSATAPVREGRARFMEWLRDLGRDWRLSEGEAAAEVDPADLPGPDVAPPAGLPASDGVLGDADTPELQGAPAIPTAVTLSIESEPGPVTYSTAQRQVFATPPYNLPSEWVPTLLYPAPADQASGETVSSLLRGEPAKGERSVLHSGHRARVPTRKGDPVDLFSGCLTIARVDLEVPTPFLPLRLAQTYRSGVPYLGPCGYNWDHNYNLYVREVVRADGTFAGAALWTGALYEAYFRYAEPFFEPEPGNHSRMEKAGANAYRITQAGGTVFEFGFPPDWPQPLAGRIPLVEIRDRHGNRQLLQYEAGRLRWVRERPRDATMETGRALEFRYGNCELLEEVRDHLGRRVQYWHHPEVEHLVRVVGPPTANYPKGVSSRYEYDEFTPYPVMRHNVLRVVDAEGNAYVENEYGGPEAGWGFNRVLRQRAGDFLTLFEYDQLQYVPEDAAFANVPSIRTVVRPPDGSLHTYTFNYRGDLLDHRFRLNRDNSGRIVETRWTYDARGNVTTIAPSEGNRVVLTYDADNPDPCARGNVLEAQIGTHLPGLAASRVLFKAIYEPVYQLLREIQGENLATTRYTYDLDAALGPSATGRLERIDLPDATLPDGAVQSSAIVMKVSPRGQVTEVLQADQTRMTFLYFENGAAFDPREGLLRQAKYDADGEAFAIEYDYDAAGHVSRVTTPPGIVTDLAVNALGQLEEMTFPAVDGEVASIRGRFTEEGSPVSLEIPRGAYSDDVLSSGVLMHNFTADVLGGLRQSIVGANTARPRTTLSCLDHEGRPVETIDPMGMRTRCCFDERGLILEEAHAVGTPSALVTRYVHDRAGRLDRIVSAEGHVTAVEVRDAWGRDKRVRLPNGSMLELDWGPMDRLLELRIVGDPGDGTATRVLTRRSFEHDERGRLRHESTYAFRSDPAAAEPLSTTYVHDGMDRVREVRLPRGGTIAFDFDGLGRLTRIADVLKNVEEIEYAAAGTVKRVTRTEIEPGGTRTLAWSFEHDARNRVRVVKLPGDETIEYAYDDRDLMVERREPLGVTTQFRYGLVGEVIEKTVDPGGLAIVSRAEHDLLGRTLRYIDPGGEETVWTRDVHGRVTATMLPDGGVWQRSYSDTALSAQEVTPSGTRFHFDHGSAAGELQVMSCEPSAGVLGVPAHSFAYDGLGRVVSASLPASAVERRYDSLGRLIEETAQGRVVRLEYDDSAGTMDIIYPDGRRERTESDLAGRPTRIDVVNPGSFANPLPPPVALFAYAGATRLHTIQFGNGTTTSFAYDDQLQLVRIDHARGDALLESCRYRYDRRGRRRVMQFLGSPPLNRLHAFDARDRLTESRGDFPLAPLADAASVAQHDADIALAEQAASGAGEANTYTLDDADSRQAMHDASTGAPPIPYTYSPGHVPETASAESFVHHQDGARTQDGAHEYEIDALGRIVTVREAATSAVLAQFAYDALSRHAAGKIAAQSFRRWFAGDRSIHEEDDSGVLRLQSTPSPVSPLPLAEHGAAGSVIAHPDALFSTITVTDASGSVVERARFAPFGAPRRFAPDGAPLPPAAPETARLHWEGMHYLSAIDLHSSRRRFYDPAHGIYLSRDPVLYGDSPSPYVFATHDPADFIDPAGTSKRSPGQESGGEERSWGEDFRRMAAAARGTRAALSGIFSMGAVAGKQPGPFHLWSGTQAHLEAQAASLFRGGYLLEDIVHLQAKALVIDLCMKLAGQPWHNIRKVAWEPPSQALARNAALSTTPVRAFGADTHPNWKGTVQFQVEIPAIRRYGAIPAGLMGASSVLTGLGANSIDNPYVQPFAYAGALFEGAGASLYTAGAQSLRWWSTASYGGERWSAHLMKGGAVLGRVGGVAGGVVAAYQLSQDIKLGNWGGIPGSAAGTVAGGALLVGATGVASWAGGIGLAWTVGYGAGWVIAEPLGASNVEAGMGSRYEWMARQLGAGPSVSTTAGIAGTVFGAMQLPTTLILDPILGWLDRSLALR